MSAARPCSPLALFLWSACLMVACGCENGLVLPDDSATDLLAFSRPIAEALSDETPTEPFHDIPYQGSLVVESGEDVGIVLLSTCGCGFWRAYTDADGDRLLSRLEFKGFPDSFSEFMTADGEPLHIVGQFERQGLHAFGEITTDRTIARFLAEPLTDTPNTGCVTCHVGDDPPLPLPDTHGAVTAATNCLECHETGPH